MTLVQAQWKAIGVDVSLNYTEESQYIDNAVTGDYVANCWTQFGSIDPDLDALWWLSSNAHPNGSIALNFARLSDATTTTALEAARESDNTAFRKAEYGKVWQQFTQEAPYIWLGRTPDALVFEPTVEGVGDGTFPNGDKQLPLAESGVDVPIDQLWLNP
jgi:ABC-type transport system substrate-binding protein